jgi:hypothetical protein
MEKDRITNRRHKEWKQITGDIEDRLPTATPVEDDSSDVDTVNTVMIEEE